MEAKIGSRLRMCTRSISHITSCARWGERMGSEHVASSGVSCVSSEWQVSEGSKYVSESAKLLTQCKFSLGLQGCKLQGSKLRSRLRQVVFELVVVIKLDRRPGGEVLNTLLQLPTEV